MDGGWKLSVKWKFFDELIKVVNERILHEFLDLLEKGAWDLLVHIATF